MPTSKEQKDQLRLAIAAQFPDDAIGNGLSYLIEREEENYWKKTGKIAIGVGALSLILNIVLGILNLNMSHANADAVASAQRIQASVIAMEASLNKANGVMQGMEAAALRTQASTEASAKAIGVVAEQARVINVDTDKIARALKEVSESRAK